AREIQPPPSRHERGNRTQARNRNSQLNTFTSAKAEPNRRPQVEYDASKASCQAVNGLASDRPNRPASPALFRTCSASGSTPPMRKIKPAAPVMERLSYWLRVETNIPTLSE